jgi:diadenosine tetraphosphate (Ap4A) HIT family hydrolase
VPFDPKIPVPPTRFAWILRGESNGPDEAFDEDLGHYAEAAVIPTRGALVAEWLLIVPRTPCFSVAELDGHRRSHLLAIADDVSARMSARAGAAVMFEHGARCSGTASGCGVDQAHLHVVGGAPDLLNRIIGRVGEVAWSAVDRADPWLAAPPDADYLMVRDHERAVRALVRDPTSQRLRRALADALGRGHEWDYRSHPNASNARRTKEIFRSAFVHAAA